MGIHAISHATVKPRHELSIFPLCLTAVALAALSPMFSMLAHPTLPTFKLVPEPVRRGYTDGQFTEDVIECLAPETDISE